MKKLNIFLAIAAGAFLFTSCEKDAGKLPNISLKTGSTYVAAATTLSKDTTVVIGINASKAEDKDVLKTFSATVSYNGGADSSIAAETLSGSNGDSYSKDITVHTRKAAGTEKYTFTVVNKDGLKNSVNVTITVN